MCVGGTIFGPLFEILGTYRTWTKSALKTVYVLVKRRCVGAGYSMFCI